ncbi:hypothetical protein LCGC14_2705180 [marine sediment metagenome]|uniref:Uncharacterized protein n=1 Tax=marine sediment metagenome TaxID=412755 RepID=A0A0F8ZEK9_9ZZZZ
MTKNYYCNKCNKIHYSYGQIYKKHLKSANKRKPQKIIIYNKSYIDYKIPKWAKRSQEHWRALQWSGCEFFDDTEDLGNGYIRLYSKLSLEDKKKQMKKFRKDIGGVSEWSKVDLEIYSD